ncbi:MAG: TrmH family RNA methyltransferase, partial [Lactococcus garvieae]
ELVAEEDFALVMGNEGAGVSDQAVAVADKLVHIEMPGRAESLNVAVAAGILMFSL